MLREAARFCQMLARFGSLVALLFTLALFWEYRLDFTAAETALFAMGLTILFAVQGSWGEV